MDFYHDQNEEDKVGTFGCLALLVVFVLFVVYMSLRLNAETGMSSDWIVAASSIFNGLAFCILAYTALVQRAEIATQRKDRMRSYEIMDEQRSHMEAQAQTLEDQSETQAVQQFESTFFKLLDVFEDANAKVIRDDVYYTEGTEDYFQGFLREMELHVCLKYNGFKRDLNELKCIILEQLDKQYMLKECGAIRNYCTRLGNLLELVDNAPVRNKKFYTNLVTSILSPHQLAFLYYYGIYASEKRKKNVVEIANRLALFQDLHMELVWSKPDLIMSYAPQAFGSNELQAVDAAVCLDQIN